MRLAIWRLASGVGGVAVALSVGICAVAGWYQVQSVHLNIRLFLVGGLGGDLLVRSGWFISAIRVPPARCGDQRGGRRRGLRDRGLTRRRGCFRPSPARLRRVDTWLAQLP